MVVAEIPRFAPDVLRGSTEHGALDRHPPVRRVVVTRGEEPLDGKPEEDDPTVLPVEPPARHLVGRLEGGDGPDLEPDLLEFRPGAPQEFDGGPHGQVESIEPTIEGSEWRTDDLAATETAVSAVPRSAPGGCGSASGTATRHD